MSFFTLLLLILAIVISSIFNIEYVYYIAFAYHFIYCLIQYKKDKNQLYFILILLFSIIIPNNYIIYIPLLILFVFFNNKKNNNHNYIVLSFVFYLIINILFREKLIINQIFSIIYYIPLLICSYKINNYIFTENDKKIIDRFLKKTLLMQLLAIALYYIFNTNIVLNSIDYDWVHGTFGIFQGNILFFYCAFLFIYFYNNLLNNRTNILYLFLSGLIMIMTGSIALIIMFIIAFFMYQIFSKNVSIKNKIITILITLVFGLVFFIVMPGWIKTYLVRLYNIDDKSYFISKINDYDNSFVKIPKNDLKYNIIGAGIGQYSSRAALTCTGIYIDGYSSLFNVSMSNYTLKYIYGKLKMVYASNLGSMDTPYSSIISIRGELGIIGLIYLMIYFYYLLKKSNGNSKIYSIFFIFSCFIENYLEFAKVISLVYLAMLIIGYQIKEYKNEKD